MAVARFFRLFPLLLSSSFVVLSPLASSVSDSEALLRLKESLINAGALDSWVPGSNPCNGSQGTWEGLRCSNGVVTGLRLEGMGLSGYIDVEALVEIQGLRVFSVANNSFTDVIPEINRLGSLKVLFLSMNQFSGVIPSEYFDNMGSLKKVWLSNNKFTGNIPVSLSRLSRLIDLHLENNQFSGQIPAFDNPTLKYINVSNNQLEGEIPSSLSKFNADSFVGNPGLCGEEVGVECSKADQPTPNDTSKTIVAALITLGAVLFIAIIFFAFRWRKKKQQNDLKELKTGNSNDAVEVPVSVITDKKEESVKSACSTRNDSNHGRPSTVAELVMVNDEKGVIGLPDLLKSAAEVLGNGSLGSSYKVKMTNGVALVVKRMRQMNALGNDAFDAEVRKLGNLRHPNVLPPLAYHYRKEEKLFVYEYFSKGSLFYQLHGDGGKSGGELDWPIRLKIVRGIAEGLDYLHKEFPLRDVPHGNLKSSNVLLGPDNHPFLSDYGFHPLVNIDGLQALCAYKTPEAVQQKTVSPKSDVYCLGIIILEILTGEIPCQCLNDSKGGTDIVQWVASAFSEGRQAELLDTGMEGCRNSVGSMEKLLRVGALCTETSPEKRLDIKETIRMIEEIQVEGSVD
ncbi:pollen receptor-like kinase 3 [Gossypium australe]|uniref:Pollen receptor-like kinase 3 n=1 Tax=Gossypium australe TaxID=47621 RepID=A0A5B6X4W8_9ROSI|nr:pollen receptor-like kinase 3 [Gossypium australe]